MSEISLIHFDTAKRHLTLATNIDEIKQIRDQAEALRQYILQQGASLEMQNQCAEIKLRAERRAGEMLNKESQWGGDRKSESRSHDVTLNNLGITKIQSHRWQLEASVPEERFEQHVAQIKAKKDELTSAGLRRLALKERYGSGNILQPELPTGVFDVILLKQLSLSVVKISQE